ncbi:DUF883 family protein [Ramlibacter sp. G-1-2-2]|uniref:DUF883 family protein n=1 Tax=Ramlibacter agri TaxID=2728837 RepID=A0A848GZ04_9BURK|nr:DUF883 family protein [Ramlibacter agri]NML43815.1 DUF883 family protein [Ramlibacter agri]
MNTDTENTLATTRRLASEALDRASSTVKDLRSNMQDAANRGMDAMSSRASAAQRYMGEYARTSQRYVADNPMKAALIAAAVGAAVAGIVIAMRHRRDLQDKYF